MAILVDILTQFMALVWQDDNSRNRIRAEIIVIKKQLNQLLQNALGLCSGALSNYPVHKAMVPLHIPVLSYLSAVPVISVVTAQLLLNLGVNRSILQTSCDLPKQF